LVCEFWWGWCPLQVPQQLERYEEWRNSKGYGYGWLVVSVFSSIKITIGEHTASKKMERIAEDEFICG